MDGDTGRLFEASCDGDLAAVKAAVAAGVAVDAVDEDKHGYQPIHAACAGGQHHIAKWLMEEHSVAVDATDHDGSQPIHYACYDNQLHIVKWLVHEKGVSLDARNN